MKPDDPSHERQERAKVAGLFVAIFLLTSVVFAWTCLTAWGVERTIVFAVIFLIALAFALLEGAGAAVIQLLGAGLLRFANWVRRRTP
jgi:hypothetical protein